MGKINNGGPAFPNPALADPDFADPDGQEHGMMLRDWFAGQFAAQTLGASIARGIRLDNSQASHLARQAYILADELLKARNDG